MDTCSEDTPNCNKLWLKTGGTERRAGGDHDALGNKGQRGAAA